MSAPTNTAAAFARRAHWSTATIDILRDTSRCPSCRRPLRAGICSFCAADLRGDEGAAVWQAASAAALALAGLQTAVAQLPRRGVGGTALASPTGTSLTATSTAGPSTLATPTIDTPTPSTPTPHAQTRASTTLQSVLAVAGGGLVALAALVFTIFNPDLTDPVARGGVLLIAALLFVGAAPVLMRRALRVSAECVAALGIVFVVLATVVLGPTVALDTSAWSVATLVALVGGAVTLALGVGARIRAWMLTGSLALTLVPVLASVALGGTTSALWGPLGSAAVALVLLDAAPRLEVRRSITLRLERVALITSQIVAFIVLAGAALLWPVEGPVRWLGIAAALLGAGAVAARTARHAPRRLWSFGAGASVPASFAIAALAIDTTALGTTTLGTTALDTTGLSAFSSLIVLVPAAALVGLLLVGVVASARGATHRRSVLEGAVAVVSVTIAPLAVLASLGVLSTLFGARQPGQGALDADTGVAIVLGIIVVSAGLALHGRLLTVRAGRAVRVTATLQASSLWLLGLAGLGALALTVINPETRAVAGIVAVAATAGILNGTSAGRRARIGARLPIVLASHVGLLLTVSLSWQSAELAVALGAATLVALAAVASTAPAVMRPAHLAVGYGYALVLVAAALSLAGISGAGQLSLTATIGLLGAIAATFVHRIDAVRWITVLIVAAVPFAMAVGLVVVERNGWVALSTATMLVLAISLLVTRRPGLGVVIRVLAAALVVPSIAVVFVNLGAQLLVMSGSPVVLPAIAVVVAITLPAISRVVSALHERGMPSTHTHAVAIALELSTLLTAGIAVALAFVREAAGPPTALAVLLVLALGFGTAAAVRGMPAYWWMLGATSTAALWCLWLILGVSSPEAHLLPPTLGAAAVAAVLTARGNPRPRLYGAALLAAVVPLVGVLATSVDASPVRAAGLVAAAVGLTVLGASIRSDAGPRARRLAALRSPTLIAAIAAGLAGCVQAARLGLGLDTLSTTTPTVVLVVVIALAGAAPAAVAGLLLTAGRGGNARRWSLVPAIAGLSVASWTAIERDPFTVGVIYTIMLALLTGMVIAAARERRATTTLPRVWVLFALALVTAIVAWSPRDLRVEWFSLPLGLMLLVAGAIAMRGIGEVRSALLPSAPLHHWPAGRAGSWTLLTPGIVVLVLASMLATVTDPQTWRAVLVMGIALAAILVGVRWRLAAPFVLGMVVLPIENVLAFSVQIGRGIEAMPWWITLAVVGLVLLVIAVGSERRAEEGAVPTARLRDLR